MSSGSKKPDDEKEMPPPAPPAVNRDVDMRAVGTPTKSIDAVVLELLNTKLRPGEAGIPFPPIPDVHDYLSGWNGPLEMQFHGNDVPVSSEKIERPHVTDIIHGTWYMVYRWPSLHHMNMSPKRINFSPPSKLETVLFSCKCEREIEDPPLAPIKVCTITQSTVMACQLVDSEDDVAPALDVKTCPCRKTPLTEKFVILPLNEHYLLHYQIVENNLYDAENPNTVHLLYRDIPSYHEIGYNISGLNLNRREGGPTFMPRFSG